ncbi:MAG: hypothetical protein AB7R40_23340 [Nitrospiraceae bacterium]
MLLSADPVTKIKRHIYFDEPNEMIAVKSEQDVTELVEGNKGLFNSFRGSWERHAEYGDLYARIPTNVWGQLVRDGIAYDDERLSAWLDDPSLSGAWRTRPGKIGRRRVIRGV